MERSALQQTGLRRLDFTITPFAVIIAWWLFSYGLYALNWPIEYTRPRFLEVTLLWIATTIFSLVAYAIVTHSRSDRTHPRRTDPSAFRGMDNLAWLGLLASLAVLPIVVPAYTGRSLFDLAAAFSDAGDSYFSSSQVTTDGAGARTSITILLAVVNVFAMTSLPYFCFCWFRFRTHLVPFLLSMLPFLILGVFTGRDYTVGLAAVVLVVAALAGMKGSIRIRPRTLMLASVSAAGLFYFIAARRASRSSYGFSNTMVDQCTPGTVCASAPDTGPFSFIPFYSSGGFQGLGHALEAQWTFGGGLAHSAALSRQLGIDTSSVVTAQLDVLGWSKSALWSTGLAQIANDVPWVLVPLAVALVVVLFGLLWRIANLDQPSPITLALLAYTGYLLGFMPQNLTLAVDGPRYVAYLALWVVWVGLSLRGNRRVSARNREGRSNGTMASGKSEMLVAQQTPEGV